MNDEYPTVGSFKDCKVLSGSHLMFLQFLKFLANLFQANGTHWISAINNSPFHPPKFYILLLKFVHQQFNMNYIFKTLIIHICSCHYGFQITGYRERF